LRMTEFDIIRRYFTHDARGALLGVGDDAALLLPTEGSVLAVSTDMLVGGTHFFPDADPLWLGHKTLAVNLSDMAAMGATPRWATLAIALPAAVESWLEAFSQGLFALAQQYGVELVGGDTTRGPLNFNVTIIGEVPKGLALLRSGARAGDEVWVSGRLGDAALALAHLQGRIVLPEAELAACASALHRPEPRVALGIALRGVANSAIDVSDGLLADLGHILDASHVGAEIDLSLVPVSPTLSGYLGQFLGMRCALAGGDDYELCFTASPGRHDDVVGIGKRIGLPLACIGKVVVGKGCTVRDASGKQVTMESAGYDHFG
jgi:thiamine-monophosphate kinase